MYNNIKLINLQSNESTKKLNTSKSPVITYRNAER